MISVINDFLDVLIYFIIFVFLFVPLESVFFAHKQSFFRYEWKTDLAFHIFQSLLWTRFTLFCLVWLKDYFSEISILTYLRKWTEEQNIFFQMFMVILLSDIFIYWGHRLSHKYDFLWRFHKIHHTAMRMDWLAAFREHPLDNIFTRVIVNLPALLLGFSLETIGGYIIFRGLWGNFIHSNTNFGLGAFKYILGSPRLHHWHHDINNNSNCNYANLMPVMDVIFGTFYDPGKMPAKYGIKEPFPRNYFLQILTPLLPEKLNRELLKRFNFIHR